MGEIIRFTVTGSPQTVSRAIEEYARGAGHPREGSPRVEPALLRSGRFDHVVRFAKPDAADRAAIVRLCCRRVPIAPDVDVMELTRRAGGLTGADLETLCKKATLLAIAEFQGGARGRPFVVYRRHFLTVLESGPSIEAAS